MAPIDSVSKAGVLQKVEKNPRCNPAVNCKCKERQWEKGFYTTRWSRESAQRLLVKVLPFRVEGAWKVRKSSQKRQRCWFLDQIWEGAEYEKEQSWFSTVLRVLCRGGKVVWCLSNQREGMPWPFLSASCCRAPSARSPGSGKSRTLPPASTSPLSAPRAALPAARKTHGSSSHRGPDGTHSGSWSISSSKPLQNTLTEQDTDAGVSRTRPEPRNLKSFQGFPLTPKECSIWEQSFSHSSNIWSFPHSRH